MLTVRVFIFNRMKKDEDQGKEGVRGVGRRERMKRGTGMKDRNERSRGIVTRIRDAFTIIKPTTPFKLPKHEALRKRASWCVTKNKRRMNSSLYRCHACTKLFLSLIGKARAKYRTYARVSVL